MSTQTPEQKAAAEKEAADKKHAAEQKAAADKKAAAEQKTRDEQKIEGETVKVKFLRSHPAFGHFAGDVADISKEAFEKYSKDGAFFEKQK